MGVGQIQAQVGHLPPDRLHEESDTSDLPADASARRPHGSDPLFPMPPFPAIGRKAMLLCTFDVTRATTGVAIVNHLAP